MTIKVIQADNGLRMEVLPCKICGNPPYIPTFGVSLSHNHYEVSCNDCGIEIINLSLEKSVEIWNKLMRHD